MPSNKKRRAGRSPRAPAGTPCPECQHRARIRCGLRRSNPIAGSWARDRRRGVFHRSEARTTRCTGRPQRVPAIFESHRFVAGGGLMSYGGSLTDPLAAHPRDVVTNFVVACVVAHNLAIEWLRREPTSVHKSVNTPVPEFLYFAGCIRQYSSGTCGIAPSNTGAITFGRYLQNDRYLESSTLLQKSNPHS